ncbi:MAG: metalloregulator ArsR/SmtB family transcription factor [Pseudomonadota bacterium]
MDAIFKALGDPARRQILDALRRDDGQTLSQLEDGFEMTRFGVMKHLGVLEDAGLITTAKRGRFKHHYLNAVPLQEAIDRWIEPLLVAPAARAMVDLKARLEGQTAMDTALPDTTMTTYIAAPPAKVFEALTDDARMTEIAPHLPPRHTTRSEAPHLLDQTLETPGDPARLVITLRPEGPHTEITLSQFGTPDDAAPFRTGWVRMLAGLKTLIETGQATGFADPELLAAPDPKKETPK